MDELKKLLDGCEAMNNEEIALWKELLEHMAESEKQKLKNILVWERDELAKARMKHSSKQIEK
jgi:hypothetical protein